MCCDIIFRWFRDADGIKTLLKALEDGGRGVVIVGILLVAAQVFVAMVNLTGVGVAVTSTILTFADGKIWLIATIMAGVCLIVGMGLPTSAAYVLVAAVFAPVLIQQGLDPVTVHLFVLYYAALSVITPPVCVAVFVAATIAQEKWMEVAKITLRLGGTAYAIPMLLLAYPGLLLNGGWQSILVAVISGFGFTMATASFFAAHPVVASLKWSWILWLIPMGFALHPDILASVAACLFIGFIFIVWPRMGDKKQV